MRRFLLVLALVSSVVVVGCQREEAAPAPEELDGWVCLGPEDAREATELLSLLLFASGDLAEIAAFLTEVPHSAPALPDLFAERVDSLQSVADLLFLERPADDDPWVTVRAPLSLGVLDLIDGVEAGVTEFPRDEPMQTTAFDLFASAGERFARAGLALLELCYPDVGE